MPVLTGKLPNQIPTNQDLGQMAFQDPQSVVLKPSNSATPQSIGDVVFQRTSDTNITIKSKAADGTVKSFELKIDRTINAGSSVSYETETFQISIPACVEYEKIIIQEKGNVYQNCKGDIVVSIQIEYISPFSRRGNDLIYSKNLTLKESLCGFSFDILHANGDTITIEEHSVFKPGSKKIMPGLGMRKEQQLVGDLIIEFSVDFPESLTTEQVELLRTIL